MGKAAKDLMSKSSNPWLLSRSKIGLLCSVKCPGSVILQTYDLMRSLRNENVTVISGFHSPMERGCLNILLRGTCGIAICYARSLPKTTPSNCRKALEDGRLLMLSAFEEKQTRATKQTCAQRNRLVASLADVIFVPYASPGGMVEKICAEAARSGKPIFTFEGDPGASLQAMGARTIPAGSPAVLLKSVPKSADAPPPKVTNSPQRTYSVKDIRRTHKRAYEKWTEEEEALLLKLYEEGRTRREIARELQRQPSAISSRLRKIEQRNGKWPNQTTQQ